MKNKGANVPFHHQYLLAQLVRGVVLSGGSEKYQNYMLYNFSGLKGQTKISRNGLHFFSSKVTLVFSAFDKEFMDYFLRQLFTMPQLEIGNLILVPESVEKENYPELEDESKFICISPLVLISPTFNDSRGKRFISPEIDEFSDILYESTLERMARLEEVFPSEKIATFSKFQLVPDKIYLDKIRENQKKFARIYPVYDQDVKYEVRGYTFPFTLFAEKEVQKFVFTCGLGSFTHKGFGMLDIANADLNSRTERYEF
ncbi:CRISPR-associated endoribonuclease Cas6 [Aureibacter tunicatorum]|uniref:CRISPR-associated endoribonuclease Cas6 n=1 Tax=Aureibacter tunicatorum TaxID=866807 RepID=A0AAE3XNL9_9BACT|nr:CRISPR-associated endoribonuclease Cas6 [Aureibacter tunicatorum]